MYQSEALWINFSGHYPYAIKIGAGKINAVSGVSWKNGLSNDPQDYTVIPEQSWLDGFNVSEDFIRQFVAMQLGEGLTAEEQITGKAEHGGLQIIIYPMKHDVYGEHPLRNLETDLDLLNMPMFSPAISESADPDLGLAPGGLMRQKIYEDEYGIDVWDQENGLRCFIHLANSEAGQICPYYVPQSLTYAREMRVYLSFSFTSDNLISPILP